MQYARISKDPIPKMKAAGFLHSGMNDTAALCI
jgi:hypothetical protein